MPSSQKRKSQSQEQSESQKRSRLRDSNDNIPTRHLSAENESNAGIVEKIHMKNFMCHSSMEIEFNKQINFITGRNGSGKSAILTALVVGLGGKACATNRGSSLKDFIKKGKNSCTIEITLKNCGQFAFKPELYGAKIVVSRTIGAASGHSTYKIRSESGGVVSNKKKELDRIVAAFNIQVDNPICVLNQDASRTFLNSGDPQDKYKLFMRATHLEQIRSLYSDILSERQKALAVVSARKDVLATASQEVRDLERRWNQLQSANGHRERAVALENELYWAVVRENEEKLNQMKDKLTNLQDQTRSLEQLLSGGNDQESVLAERESELMRRISELDSETRIEERKRASLLAEYHETKNQFQDKTKAFIASKGKIQNTAETIRLLNLEVTKIQSGSETDRTSQRQQVDAEVARLEKRLNEVVAVQNARKEQCRQLSGEKNTCENDIRTLEQEQRELSRKAENIKRRIAEFQSESNNLMSVFGSWVPRVLQRIEEADRANKFERKPIGPIGAHIKVRDSTWIPAIESYIGANVLRAFCVHSAGDARVLNQILAKTLNSNDRKPPLYTSRFLDQVHNVNANAVRAPGYHSLLDVLTIEEPVVANTLIDQSGLETVLLIPTNTEAREIMSNAQRVPANCSRALTKGGDQYYPDPNYRTYAGSVGPARYLQVSSEQMVQRLQSEAQEVMQHQAKIATQLTALRDGRRGTQHALEEAARQYNSLVAEQGQLSAQLAELRQWEEPESSNAADLLAELQECEKKKSMLEAQRIELKAECEQKKLDTAEALDKKNIQDQLVKSMQEQRESLEQELQTVQCERTKISGRKDNSRKEFEEHCLKMKRLDRCINQQQQELDKAVTQATELSEKVETDRSSAVVKEELEECRRHVHMLEAMSGTQEEVGAALEEKQGKYRAVLAEIRALEEVLKRLGAMMRRRGEHYLAAESLMTVRIQHLFLSMLKARHFKGRIEINHNTGVLDVIVLPPHTGQKAVSDNKSLSGGERSYTTVAFVMALWDVVEPPFYFLDEFDVFMDKVNRRIVLDTLLSHAQQKTSCQFVFFTPLDISSIQPGPTVTIHRMESPHD